MHQHQHQPMPDDPGPCPDLEITPTARRRDWVRNLSAGGVGLSTLLVGVLLSGQEDLRHQTERLADGLQAMQFTVERVQAAAVAAQATDRLAHQMIEARMAEHEQSKNVITRDIETLARGMVDLTQRVTKLETAPGGLRQ